MADRGGITQNHYDHVHITFTGSSCVGKNCAGARASLAEQQQLPTQVSSQDSSSTTSATPSWAVGIVVLSVLSAIGTVVVVVMLLITMRKVSN